MVFWKTYPISNIIKKWNTGIFTDLRFEKEDVFTFESTILDTNKEVLEIKTFFIQMINFTDHLTIFRSIFKRKLMFCFC